MKLVKKNKILVFILALLMTVLPLSQTFAQDSGGVSEYDEFGEKVMQEIEDANIEESWDKQAYFKSGKVDLTKWINEKNFRKLRPYFMKNNGTYVYKDGNKWIGVKEKSSIPTNATEFTYLFPGLCDGQCLLSFENKDNTKNNIIKNIQYYESSLSKVDSYKEPGVYNVEYKVHSDMDFREGYDPYDGALKPDMSPMLGEIIPYTFKMQANSYVTDKNGNQVDKSIINSNLLKKIANLSSVKFQIEFGHSPGLTYNEDATLRNTGEHLNYSEVYKKTMYYKDNYTDEMFPYPEEGTYYVFDIQKQIPFDTEILIDFSATINMKSSIDYSESNDDIVHYNSTKEFLVLDSNYYATSLKMIQFSSNNIENIDVTQLCLPATLEHNSTLNLQKITEKSDMSSRVTKLDLSKPLVPSKEQFKFVLLSYEDASTNFSLFNIAKEGEYDTSKDTELKLVTPRLGQEKYYFLIETDAGVYNPLRRMLVFKIYNNNNESYVKIRQIDAPNFILEDSILDYIRETIIGKASKAYIGEEYKLNEALIEFHNGGLALPGGPSCMANFTVYKMLEGRELKANEFTFDLIDEQGKIVSTATNDENGLIKFLNIEVSSSAQIYKVVEHQTDDNIIYDDDEKHIEVIPTIPQTGSTSICNFFVEYMNDEEKVDKLEIVNKVRLENYPLPMTGKHDSIILISTALSLTIIAILLKSKKKKNTVKK